MTFTEKKIEEFESKVIAIMQDAVSCGEIDKKNLDDLKDLLRKTIAEAEREGQIKAYKYIANENKEAKDSNEEISKRLKLTGNTLIEANQRINCFGNQIIMCENKLKELEQE